MKKLYTTPEYKSRSRRQELGRRRRSSGRKGYHGESGDRFSRYNVPEEDLANVEYDEVFKRVVIRAPKVFSIVDNHEEVLAFFNAVYHYASGKQELYFDMSKIHTITSDAILYLLSFFEYHKYKFAGTKRYSGNYPENENCKRFLVQSGFVKYVKTKEKIDKSSDDVMSIESDRLVSPHVASEFINYAKKCYTDMESRVSRSLYRIFIEIMSNTNNHAYERRTSGARNKWWLIAMKDDTSEVVTFTMTDNGMGIPRTVRHKIKEMIRRKLVSNSSDLDSDLILSALKGNDNRSSTWQSWRGKGLPSIYDMYVKGDIKNLSIISNTGFFDGVAGKTVNMKRKFYGTLLTWQVGASIVGGQSGNN